MELREIIKSLLNKPIRRPDIERETNERTVEEHIKEFPENMKALFRDLDSRIKSISGEIWDKPMPRKPGVTYYSPERVFVYVNFQEGGLRLTIFTRGEAIDGVKNFEYERGGAKWGRIP